MPVDPPAPPDVLDVLDEIEAEIVASPALPVGEVVGVNAERMAVLTTRLREAVARAREAPLDEATRRGKLQQAEAQAALLIEDARRKADMLLDGERVKKLRNEQTQAIIQESRQRGEVLVADAYTYARARMEEVYRCVEEARGYVAQARDATRIEHEGLGRRLAGAAAQLVKRRGGILSRLRRS
ncbi:MAG: hypothetical protein PVSMB4_01790 [Ktedonobacterales bacterium]